MPCQPPSSTRPSASSPAPWARRAAARSSSRRAAGAVSSPCRWRRCRSASSRTGSTTCSTRTPRAPPPSRSARATPSRSSRPSRTSSGSTHSALAWDPERLVLVIECHDQDPEEVADAEETGVVGLSTLRVVLVAAGGPGLRPALRQGDRGRPPGVPVLRPAARPLRPHLPPCQRIPALSSRSC